MNLKFIKLWINFLEKNIENKGLVFFLIMMDVFCLLN